MIGDKLTLKRTLTRKNRRKLAFGAEVHDDEHRRIKITWQTANESGKRFYAP